MSDKLHRVYSEERVISSDPSVPKWIVLSVCVAAMVFFLVLDLADPRNNLFYLRSMLAAVVGGGLIVSMLRHLAHFVDDVRAGPEYLVVRRRGVSVTVPLEQIAQVRFNALVPLRRSPLLETRTGFLERFEIRLLHATEIGSVIAFSPDSGWRGTWPPKPVLQRLRAAVPRFA